MFVRLFVDENLDRMVPISRQPKEKIQAIIDSCNRQFPEFMERARKRIRTYLKSCRRTRRHKSPAKETLPKDSQATRVTVDPTPITCAQLPVSSSSYHLSSPLAEQILATACDNEYQNAKRMRIGLKPIGVDTSSSDGGDPEDLSLASFAPPPMLISDNHQPVTNHLPPPVHHPIPKPPIILTGVTSSGAAVQVLKPSLSAHSSSSSLLAALCQKKKLESNDPSTFSSIFCSFPSLFPCFFLSIFCSCLFLCRSFSSFAILNNVEFCTLILTTFHSFLFPDEMKESNQGVNGPNKTNGLLLSGFDANLRLKNGTGNENGGPSPSIYSLNPSEMAAVKQLISGYRESAAFLLRSADELENLLFQQPN